MKSQLDRRLALLLLAVAGLDTPLKVVEAKLGGAQTYNEPRPRVLQTSDNSKRLEIFRKTLPTQKGLQENETEWRRPRAIGTVPARPPRGYIQTSQLP